MSDSLVLIVIYAPVESGDTVRKALDEAGAGHLGDYRGYSWSTVGTGRFTPLQGAQPTIGAVGTEELVPEERIEVVAPREQARKILTTALAAHPYEEPAYHVLPVLTLEDL